MRLMLSKDSCIKPKMEDLIDLPVVVKVIKFDDDAVKEFFSEMQKAFSAPQPVVPVLIDSYGGGVYEMLAMADIIKSSPKPVSTIAIGKTMSAGATLFSFGTKGYRYAAQTTTFMIHEVAGWSWGKVNEVKADAEEIERLNDMVFRAMAKNCGQKPTYFLDKIHEKNHAEWYLTAEQALAEGLPNHIGMPTLRVKIEAKFSYGL